MNIILRCPRCGNRKEISYDEFVKSCLPLTPELDRIHCESERCETKPIMLYHKDVKE
jgi:hypothetical protein